MPILKSAFKRVRSDKKRHARNSAIKSELKTLRKKFEKSIAEKNLTEAKNLVRMFSSKLDKAVTKGVVHRNTAARKKSRLEIRVQRLAA